MIPVSRVLTTGAVGSSSQNEAQQWVWQSLRHSFVCHDYDLDRDWTLDEARFIINSFLFASYK